MHNQNLVWEARELPTALGLAKGSECPEVKDLLFDVMVSLVLEHDCLDPAHVFRDLMRDRERAGQPLVHARIRVHDRPAVVELVAGALVHMPHHLRYQAAVFAEKLQRQDVTKPRETAARFVVVVHHQVEYLQDKRVDRVCILSCNLKNHVFVFAKLKHFLCSEILLELVWLERLFSVAFWHRFVVDEL